MTITTNKPKKCLPCPVTGGVSTRMTLESFIAACRVRMRNRTTNCWGHDVARSIFPQRCNWCKGKKSCWPDELVLTTDVIKAKKRSRQMTANTTGCVCDICGATANNKKNKSRGMTLCSSCKGIVPCVDRLDVVVAMMQRTGKAEELLDKLKPQQDNSNRLEQELQGIAGIVGCTVNDIIPSLNELAAHLGCGHGEMLTALYSHDHDTNDNKSYQLELENNRLKRENEYLAQRKRQEPLDNALLEWARKQYEAGEIKLKVTVEAADENN